MRYLFSLLILFLSFACSYAQTNSVVLMDNLGNAISTHSTIQGAYNAIPATLTQPYVIELQKGLYKGTQETYPIRFVEKAGASSTNTITIIGPYRITIKADTADVFQFDGADWMLILPDAMSSVALFSPGVHHAVHFKNGACNNLIRGLGFGYGIVQELESLGGHFIYFGPTTVPGGNSNNRIELCELSAGVIAIRSDGHISQPNRNITIRSCQIGGFLNGISFSHSEDITIEDNYVNFTGVRNHTRGLIDISSSGGSININRNHIFMRPDSGVTAGIYIAAEKLHDVFIANNAIITGSEIKNNKTYFDTATDLSNNLWGIWIDGKMAPGKNRIYHNTIAFWKNYYYSSGSSDIQSACLRFSGLHVAGFDVRNNLFLNYRKYGKNAKHSVYNFWPVPSDIILNNNRYSSYGGMATIWGSNSLSRWSDYQGAMQLVNSNNESSSDSAAVYFAEGFGSRGILHTKMAGDVSMYGTPLPDVPNDIIGAPRANYYKGAREFRLVCPSQLNGGYIYETIDNCGGNYSSLEVFSVVSTNGLLLQWQVRPAASPSFFDIPGENFNKYYPKNGGPADYRVKVTCTGSSDVAYSDTVTMSTLPLPSVDSIRIEKENGWEYKFHAIGAQLTSRYIWNFGEGPGSQTVSNPATYSFKTPGPHDIRLIVTNNNCGYDTVYTTLDVGLGIDDATTANTIKIYPNPATDRLMADVAENTAYTVTDISGRIVLKGNINASGIDISRLSKGLYLLGLVMPDDTRVYTRFVKE